MNFKKSLIILFMNGLLVVGGISSITNISTTLVQGDIPKPRSSLLYSFNFSDGGDNDTAFAVNQVSNVKYSSFNLGGLTPDGISTTPWEFDRAVLSRFDGTRLLHNQASNVTTSDTNFSNFRSNFLITSRIDQIKLYGVYRLGSSSSPSRLTGIHLQKSSDNLTWENVKMKDPLLSRLPSEAQIVTFSLAEDSETDNPPPLIEAGSYIRIGISLDIIGVDSTRSGIHFTRLDIHNYDLC